MRTRVKVLTKADNEESLPVLSSIYLKKYISFKRKSYKRSTNTSVFNSSLVAAATSILQNYMLLGDEENDDKKEKILTALTNLLSNSKSENSNLLKILNHERLPFFPFVIKLYMNLNSLYRYVGNVKFFSEKNEISITLPPLEYCSLQLLSAIRTKLLVNRDVPNVLPEIAPAIKHRRKQNCANFDLLSIPTDKGGTLKQILQSNKSFLHYLTTYPLRNTFRGYIQTSSFLEPNAIGIPLRYALDIFGPNIRKPDIHHKDYNGVIKYRWNLADDEWWPDDRFYAKFNTNDNFEILIKRDPCLHDGSIMPIDTIYIYSLPETECIFVSQLVLMNMNADFDGDSFTGMIVRGIEASEEVHSVANSCMLFGGKTRYTFSQSMVYTAFRCLLFDDDNDEKNCMSIFRDPTDYHDKEPSIEESLRVGRLSRINKLNNIRAFMRERLTCENVVNRQRIRAFFQNDAYADLYIEICRKTKLYENNTETNNKIAVDDSIKEVWTFNVLNEMLRTLDFAHNNRRKGHKFIRHMLKRFKECSSQWCLSVLDNVPFCYANILICMSGAKGSSFALLQLCDKYQEYIRFLQNMNDSTILNECPLSSLDFFKMIDVKQSVTNRQYLDDFVLISKNVPKSSYFSSGLKWVSQLCVLRDGDLYYQNDVIMQQLENFLPLSMIANVLEGVDIICQV